MSKRTNSRKLKLLVLAKIRENKTILFGAITNKRTKLETWKKVLIYAQSIGAVSAEKNFNYLRDIWWPNIRKSTMSKIDISKENKKRNELDDAVLDILTRELPVNIDFHATDESIDEIAKSEAKTPNNHDNELILSNDEDECKPAHIFTGDPSETNARLNRLNLQNKSLVETWEKVLVYAQSIGALSPEKDYTYLRDIWWPNIRKTSLIKIDNAKIYKKRNDVDDTDILTKESPPNIDFRAPDESLDDNELILSNEEDECQPSHLSTEDPAETNARLNRLNLQNKCLEVLLFKRLLECKNLDPELFKRSKFSVDLDNFLK